MIYRITGKQKECNHIFRCTLCLGYSINVPLKRLPCLRVFWIGVHCPDQEDGEKHSSRDCRHTGQLYRDRACPKQRAKCLEIQREDYLISDLNGD